MKLSGKHNEFKIIVLTNSNSKLLWGLTWNIHTAKIMSYQVFDHSYSANRKKLLVEYQGREWQGEDLCDYGIRAVNNHCTLQYLRFSLVLLWI